MGKEFIDIVGEDGKRFMMSEMGQCNYGLIRKTVHDNFPAYALQRRRHRRKAMQITCMGEQILCSQGATLPMPIINYFAAGMAVFEQSTLALIPHLPYPVRCILIPRGSAGSTRPA